MNLSEQKLTGTNEIHLLDSQNASLLELKVKPISGTLVPNTNSLIIYVSNSDNVDENANISRKNYTFELSRPLAYLNDVSDEFEFSIKIENNDVLAQTIVRRNIQDNTVLEEPILEILETIPLTLFEGENYIYTNYTDINIELMYSKNNDLNRNYLSNIVYYDYKLNHPEDFSLDDIYFKDAFTKVEDKLNLEVDNLNIGCLTSQNNKFSLDSDGNLVVNSISTLQASNNQSVVDLIYPVGSIYLSVSATNPSLLFGGTWEQIQDKFLLGASDTYAALSTGGSTEHNHTSAAHTHGAGTLMAGVNVNQYGTTFVWTSSKGYTANKYRKGGSGSYGTGTNDENSAGAVVYGTSASTTPGNTGSSSNIPPYLAVYMWKRIV